MEWWKFNGYGLYVWGSYLVAFAVVAIESALLVARRKRALRQLEDGGGPDVRDHRDKGR